MICEHPENSSTVFETFFQGIRWRRRKCLECGAIWKTFEVTWNQLTEEAQQIVINTPSKTSLRNQKKQLKGLMLGGDICRAEWCHRESIHPAHVRIR